MERSCLARDWSYLPSHNVRRREGQRRRPTAIRAFSLLRILFVTGLVVGPAGVTALLASDEPPQPPCAGASPLPAYASPGAAPAIRVWARRDASPAWVPPSCTGWT